MAPLRRPVIVDEDGNIYEKVGQVLWGFNVPEERERIRSGEIDWRTSMIADDWQPGDRDDGL